MGQVNYVARGLIKILLVWLLKTISTAAWFQWNKSELSILSLVFFCVHNHMNRVLLRFGIFSIYICRINNAKYLCTILKM